MSKKPRPRAQMQRKSAPAYQLTPWAAPVNRRTRELIAAGQPALQAAYRALSELGPVPFEPESQDKHLSALYHTAIATLASLELEPVSQPTETDRVQAWARARAIIGRELGAE